MKGMPTEGIRSKSFSSRHALIDKVTTGENLRTTAVRISARKAGKSRTALLGTRILFCAVGF